MRIVGSHEIANYGLLISEPVTVHWHWWYTFRTWPLWAMLLLLLVVPKANRRPQAWLILIPLALVLIVWRMPVRWFSLSDELASQIEFVVFSLGLAWSMVWLVGHWMREYSRISTFFFILIGMVAIGWVSAWCHFNDAAYCFLYSVASGILAFLLAASMQLASRRMRSNASLPYFSLWLMLWTWGMATIMISPFVVLMLFARPLGALFVFAVVPLLYGGSLYLCNLPFVILAFKSPFYRDRFDALFHKTCLQSQIYGVLNDALALSTEPTAKPVTANDVVGRWQFYVDRISRTVTVEFQADGTFTQTIVANQGGVQPCPGGTWKLDGPTLHLEGYVSAEQNAGQSCVWWFIDTSSGLAIYGGDGVDPQFLFCIRRDKSCLK